jgi:hypothetical protein
MGMPGKPGQVLFRDVVAEIIEKKEGIEVGGIAESESPAEVDARTLKRGLCMDYTLDRSQ